MAKATEEEALGALKKEIRVWCQVPYLVNAATDDGGRYLQLWIEQEEPSERMEGWMCEMLPSGRYMGWRLIISKCPPGYIDAFLTGEKKKDW